MKIKNRKGIITMKLVKDLAAFTVEEGWMAFLVFVTAFTAWATSGVIKAYMMSGHNSALMFVAITACWILNVVLIATAVKLVLDAFSEFRASRENEPA